MEFSGWEIAGQFFLGLVVSLWLLWPYIQKLGDELQPVSEFDEEQDLRDSTRQVLSDLEYDFATGKLSRADYERLRRTILSEAENLEELREPDPEQSNSQPEDPALERAIRDAREKLEGI